MTCEEFEAQLTAFSLGELGADDATQARAHVARCDRCAASTLRDRQLTALLRSSMVEMPAAAQTAVLAAVRSEAARGTVVPAGRPDAVAGGRVRRHRPSGRRRHWLALAGSSGLAAVVLAMTVLLLPAPDRSSPIQAAWKLYRLEPVAASTEPSEQTVARLTMVLGAAARPPDLRGFGLEPVGWDGRVLANHLATVAEYRDREGRRVTLMRWRGELPHPTKGSPVSYEDGMVTAQWGETGSVWFKTGDVVSCLVGTVDEHTLGEIAHQLGA
jgi:anti-sigma factor RsiW